MIRSESEARLLLVGILRDLEAADYEVHTESLADHLPRFVGEYRPDALALGKPRNLAIEVTLEGVPAKSASEEIRRRFDEDPDWDLRVYYARPKGTAEPVEPVPVASIDASIREIQELHEKGQEQLALLRAWATLEALGRKLLPGKFERPQTPGRLVEVLAFEGNVTPTEAELLRNLANNRNRFIHGSLDVEVDPSELARFAETLKELRDQLPAR